MAMDVASAPAILVGFLAVVLSSTAIALPAGITKTGQSEPPPKPTNITCVSDNWRDMVCSWDTGVDPDSPAAADTTWTLYWKVHPSRSFYLCPHPVGPNQCQWWTTDGLDSFRDGMIYRILVGATNSRGRSWSSFVWIDTNTIVRPAQVRRPAISVRESQGQVQGQIPTAIDVAWTPPRRLNRRLSLTYEIQVIEGALSRRQQQDAGRTMDSPVAADDVLMVRSRTMETVGTHVMLAVSHPAHAWTLVIRALPVRGGFWGQPLRLDVHCLSADDTLGRRSPECTYRHVHNDSSLGDSWQIYNPNQEDSLSQDLK